MGVLETYPIIPLPYDTVPVPGRKLHIGSVNRPDIVAIIANYYNGAFGNKTQDNSAALGCIPLRSPYLGPDGHKLIESTSKNDRAERQVPDPAHATKDDLFNYGVLAKIQGIEGGRTGEIKLVLDCTTRFRVDKFTQDKPYIQARCQVFKDEGQYGVFCVCLRGTCY